MFHLYIFIFWLAAHRLLQRRKLSHTPNMYERDPFRKTCHAFWDLGLSEGHAQAVLLQGCDC